MTLRKYIEKNGGAIGITEATGHLMDEGFSVDERLLRELHSELEGPVVGRSMILTPDLADEIEDELELEAAEDNPNDASESEADEEEIDED